jgi:hypothetical protein
MFRRGLSVPRHAADAANDRANGTRAKRTSSAFQRIIDEPVETLEDTLRTAWGMQPTGHPPDSAQMFVSGVATAGASLQHPAADLEAIRPHVAKWSASKGRARQERQATPVCRDIGAVPTASSTGSNRTATLSTCSALTTTRRSATARKPYHPASHPSASAVCITRDTMLT